ncbi:MAG: bifunctional adenosylcobinamide kinase/adenosylcobinamide-phosphate guanylyltransferase [SAR324 cluster bacterium]|nr:bifunctional adenosylcobinamide kinase/adenosylcobinamide-phosphate guanylyltransferase [SAR324 cluster bacterium]
MKILVTGGVKSGKSRIAEQRSLDLAEAEKAIYLATTEMIDPEMEERIRVHQERRKDRFITVEEPMELHSAILRHDYVILVECLTMWINNMLFHQKTEHSILNEIERVLQLPNHIVFVLNEVGMGVIPDNPLARQFIDISGKVSQIIGSHADEILYCVAGQTLRVK